MSYKSRNYRHRNPKTGEEQKTSTPFFKSGDPSVQTKKKNAFFQAKLSIGQPGNTYEREADSVANQVVNQKHGDAPVVQQKEIHGIQRLATSKEEDLFGTNDARMEKDKEEPLKPLQRKPSPGGMDGMEKKKKKQIQKVAIPEEKKKKLKGPGAIQRKAGANNASATPQLSSRIEQSSGKGSSMSPATLNNMQSAFGLDFSNVHIHTNEEAAKMNNELEAQAFATGRDIYFNRGKYDPQSAEGKLLLAHELTHVVQQTGAGDRDTNLQRQSTSSGQTSPGLGAAKAAQVDALIQAGNFQEAIDQVVWYAGEGLDKNYSINTDLLEGSAMTYDPALTYADANTAMASWDYINNQADRSKVKIGPGAFSSVAYLYSVIMHEYQHVLYAQSQSNQALAKQASGHGGMDTEEVEASAWELLHATETGLDKLPDKVAEVWEQLNNEYWLLDPQAQATSKPLAQRALLKAQRFVKGSGQTLIPFQP